MRCAVLICSTHRRSLLFFGFWAACLTAPAVARPADSAPSTDCSSQRPFCAAIARYAKQLRLPGYALAVARDGRIVYTQTEGFADSERRTPIRTDSIFPIASITKTFTAALMMRYAEAGRIGLDDYLTGYPQFANAAAWLYNSPDIRIRHVISQTSEGAKPGAVFSYNGNRFNAVYGVFAKLSGDTDYARAFAGEVHAQILAPLGMHDTLTAFPGAAAEAHAARIVTPYRYDTQQHAFVADNDLKTGHRLAYPNSGMLSTLADLVRYIAALDRGELMRAASVEEMTTPFRLNRGASSPYGLGWFSEEWNGTKIYWVYGLGPSYCSFLLHVPSEKLSFVFFANNDAPTAALRLNYGNALQFPPAAAFLRQFAALGRTIPAIDPMADARTLESTIARLPAAARQAAFAQLTGVALTQRYTEKTYDERPGGALALAAMLRRIDPGYFRALRPELIALALELADPSLTDAMDDLGSAYAAAGAIDPRISQYLANFYAQVGAETRAIDYRAALIAAPGYETNEATIASAFALGDQYFHRGDIAAGRNAYWIGIRDATAAGWSAEFANTKRQRMNELSGAKGVRADSPPGQPR